MFRHIKKLLALSVALIMSAGLLSGCGADPDVTPAPTPSPTASPESPDGQATALTVGDIQITADEYNIFYLNIYNQFIQEYGYDDADPSDMGDDFYRMIEEETDKTVQGTVSMAAEARKNGMDLSEESRQMLEQTLASLDEKAEELDLSTDDYLSTLFSQGVTRAVYGKSMADALLAEQWIGEKAESFTYSQSEYDAYYDGHRDRLDTVSIRYFPIRAEDYLEDQDQDDEYDDAALTAAGQEARSIAYAFLDKVDSQAAFADAVIEFAPEDSAEHYRENPDATLFSNLSLSDLPENLYAWLADSERREGDKTVVESDGFFPIMYFVSRQRADYQPVTMRHILFLFKDEEDTETATPTDEQKEAAGTLAQDAWDRWKAGDATEESFAELANEVSEDEGSNYTGGLYEDIPLGQMVAPFEEWCFDASRETGDTGLVETMYGFHVMYYVSKADQPAWVDLAHEQMIYDSIDAYIDEIREAYPLVKDEYGMSQTILRRL